MRAQVDQLIDGLRTGFWFLPSVMIFVAIALALTLLRVDAKVDPGINTSLAWAYSGGPSGARPLLSTIAGSMITAASVTFSLASVALSIASQQYGSRVLRNFMRDTITQVLLGTFVSTFVYSVLVVRSIRGSDETGGFVPAISVTGAIALSVLSLILLVYFVHHVSTSIQASHIVWVIVDDLEKAIPALYPSSLGKDVDGQPDLEAIRRLPSHPVSRQESGYVQSIDTEGLLHIASRLHAVVELLIKPGDHSISEDHLAMVWADGPFPEDARRQIAGAFIIGGQRTPLQDIRYQFQQLTDVIIRALSPAINDPFTAINGIDALASAASRLARRPRTPQLRADASGALRLIVATPQVDEIICESVGHIALYAAGNPFVMRSLRRVVQAAEPYLVSNHERAALLQCIHDLDKKCKDS